MELLKIGIQSNKDIRKDVPIFQIGGSAPVPPTPPVFRAVLLHTVASGKILFRGSVLLGDTAKAKIKLTFMD